MSVIGSRDAKSEDHEACVLCRMCPQSKDLLHG